MEATIQNKMRLDKCDAYTAKETKLQGEKILCVRGKRSRKKRRKTEEDKKKQIYRQITGAPKKEEGEMSL